MSVDRTTRRAGSASRHTWTNQSVRRLLDTAGEKDPVRAITLKARELALSAMDRGWSGPPFDPLRLADLLGILVSPRHDLRDARTLPAAGGKTLIEFNPNRPSPRIRYSIAHEIAHTLFPDSRDRIRHRHSHDEVEGDEWQLEAICNVGAAELLMPLGSLMAIKDSILSIESLMALRKQFEVSMEALLIRVVRFSETATAMFCASAIERGKHIGRYRIDYMIRSQAWTASRGHDVLPDDTVLSQCAAIGYTASAVERWGESRLRVEAVGIPPYPGSRIPRVVGVLKAANRVEEAEASTLLQFVRGDALQPRGAGPKMVVHIVNDKTPNWGGGGFAQAVRRQWPAVQVDFQKSVAENRRLLTLGNARVCDLPHELLVASVVAQKGYGESVGPRLRYAALRHGLESVATAAIQRGASIHMPRIGTGQGGGSWAIVEDIIRAVFGEAGLSVTVYDLPGAPIPPRLPLQDELSFA
jgi:O-acetyl-ADP-ribose deacetylase (regulator of RNase III)